jgi:hypothetical protein
MLRDEYQSPPLPSRQADEYHEFGVFCSGLDGKLSLDTTKLQVEQLLILSGHIGTFHRGLYWAHAEPAGKIVAQSQTKSEQPFTLHDLNA